MSFSVSSSLLITASKLRGPNSILLPDIINTNNQVSSWSVYTMHFYYMFYLCLPFLGHHYLDHATKKVEEGVTHCMTYLSMLLNMENQEKTNRGKQKQKQKTERSKVNRLQMQQRKREKERYIIYWSLSICNPMPRVLT